MKLDSSGAQGVTGPQGGPQAAFESEFYDSSFAAKAVSFLCKYTQELLLKPESA